MCSLESNNLPVHSSCLVSISSLRELKTAKYAALQSLMKLSRSETELRRGAGTGAGLSFSGRPALGLDLPEIEDILLHIKCTVNRAIQLRCI